MDIRHIDQIDSAAWLAPSVQKQVRKTNTATAEVNAALDRVLKLREAARSAILGGGTAKYCRSAVQDARDASYNGLQAEIGQRHAMATTLEVIKADVVRAQREAKQALEAAESGATETMQRAGITRVLPIHVAKHADVEGARKHYQQTKQWLQSVNAQARTNHDRLGALHGLLEDKAKRLAV